MIYDLHPSYSPIPSFAREGRDRTNLTQGWRRVLISTELRGCWAPASSFDCGLHQQHEVMRGRRRRGLQDNPRLYDQ